MGGRLPGSVVPVCNAAQLSAPFNFIRVDLYTMVGGLRMGELTNCLGAARQKVTPPEAEFLLGRFFDRQKRTDER